MKSIYEYIAEMDEGKWNYYSVFNDNEHLEKPFVNNISNNDFIKKYFIKGGKGPVLKDFDVDKFSVERAGHTCSIFFLGLIFYHESVFKNSPSYNVLTPGYEFFAFIWFLTCLSHDAGFQNEKKLPSLRSIWDIDSLKKKEKIIHDLLRQEINGVPSYLFRSISKYFIYRRFSFRVVDHGIYAGMVLFDRLVKNRHYKKKKIQPDDLFWADSLDSQYALATAIIAVHNIWLPSDEKAKSDYQYFDLLELCGNVKIKFQDSPLLFLLCLVDSIDPVKIFNELPEEVVLKSINVAFDGNIILLDYKKNSGINFDDLKFKVNNLETWLDVSVNNTNTPISITVHT